MQVLTGNGRSIQQLILVMPNQPVLIILEPELDPPLAHQLFFVILLEAAATHIVTQLIEIIGSFEDHGIHLSYIAHDMRRRVEGIDPDGAFLEIEARKFPDILFQPGVHVRGQQVFEDRGAESAVLRFCIQDAAAEFEGIDAQQLAEISGVDILYLCGSDHEIIKNGIVQDRPSLPVINDPPGRVNAFPEQGVLLRLSFILSRNDLQVKQLSDDDQEHARENEADDIAAGLIEYRHKNER